MREPSLFPQLSSRDSRSHDELPHRRPMPATTPSAPATTSPSTTSPRSSCPPRPSPTSSPAVRYATARGLGVAVQATGHGPSRPADGQLLITTVADGRHHDRSGRAHRSRRGGRPRRRAGPGRGRARPRPAQRLVARGRRRVLPPRRRDRHPRPPVRLGRRPRPRARRRDRRRRAAPGHRDVGARAVLGPARRRQGQPRRRRRDRDRPAPRLPALRRRHALRRRATPSACSPTWADWTRTAPEEMGTSVLLVRMPDLPFLPDADPRQAPRRTSGSRSPATLRRASSWSRPFRELGPLTDTVAEMPYAQVGTIHAEPTDAGAVPRPQRDAAHVRRRRPSPSSSRKPVRPDAPYIVELRHMGGAFARPGAVPSALGRRDGEYVLYAGGAGGAADAPVDARGDRTA